MAYTLYKQGFLRPPKAPNLLIAPVEYTQQYQDQLLNALRLYFNQIDNFNASAGLYGNGSAITGLTVNSTIVGLQANITAANAAIAAARIAAS